MFASREDDTYSILRVAQEAGLEIKLKVLGNPSKGYKTNCPFCGDKKGNLELHGDRDVFHSWCCQLEGGVIYFYALLHNMTVQSAKEELRDQSRRNRGYDSQQFTFRKKVYRHPAENLTSAEIRELGFINPPNWNELKQRDPERAKSLANWIWNEKVKHDRLEKQRVRCLAAIRREIENAEKQGEITQC